MKNLILKGSLMAVIMGSAMFSSTAFAADQPEYAEVIKIEEIKETVDTTREVCEDVEVTQKAQPKDQHKIAGTAAGAVAGGALGSLVGGGRGKTLATVAGAAAGGYAGRKVQGSMQDKKTTTTTERQCQTVTEPEKRSLEITSRTKLEKKKAPCV